MFMKKLILFCVFAAAAVSAKQYEIYNPQITRGYMYPPGELRYNHDASIEYFQGRFYGAWNGNTNRWESKPGQKNYWAVSDDGLNWGAANVYSNVPSFGHPNWQTEWQPNLLNWKNRELWSLWTKSGGFLLSKLNESKTGWEHRLVWESVMLHGIPMHIFPTQEATVLSDGSVLVPCVFRTPSEIEPDFHKQIYYSGPAVTRDGGQTFFVPEGALVEHPEKGKAFKMWEPMYVVQDDGKVRMFNRTYSMGFDSSELPTNALITALGSADGEQMGATAYSAIRTVHSRMWLGYNGNRRLMIHHDSMKNEFPRDRINISLFSSRTGRDDFVAGIPIEDSLIGIAYPQAVFVDDVGYVCYTHQGDPATIVVNKIDPLPSDNKWYIFPRSGNRSLSGNDQPRSVAASIGNPDYLEFYSAAYDVRSGPLNELGTNSVTVTGWLSMRPKNDGVIFNGLSPDGKTGFSLRFNYDGALILTLGGENKGEEITVCDPVKMAGLNYKNGWDYTPWFYFAVTVDNAGGKVFYWNNQQLARAARRFEPGRNLSSGRVPGFGLPQSQLFVKNHYPLYAKVNSIRVYDRVLEIEEMRYDFNRFAGAADTELPAKDPGEPTWRLDVNSYGDEFVSVKNRRPMAMPVEQNGSSLTFCGNSAAGVDLEHFDPETDAVEVTLPVQMDRPLVGETVLLMTMGDNNDIMIGLRRDDPSRVYVNCNGTWIPACNFSIGQKNRLMIHMDKNNVTVANGCETVAVPNNSISQRLYLGDGYPSFYIAPADRFIVAVDEFDAKVIPGGCSGAK